MKKNAVPFWGLAIALLLMAGGAAFAQGSEQDGKLWLPDGASTYSYDVDFLYYAIFWVTTGMFILVEGLIVVFCVIYRRRPGHRPAYTHGNNKAEITWTVVPGLMLLGLAFWQIPYWNAIKKPDWNELKSRPNVTKVDVIGESFKWNFRYPGTKKKYSAEFEYTNLSNLHVPFGDTAYLALRTKDVIHSMFIPHMRVKQDTVPGLRQQIWFKPNRYKLIDLKTAPHQEGKKVDGSPRMVQKFEWVVLDVKAPDKDFEAGGKYFDKKVAVSTDTYAEMQGLYDVMRPPGGNPKKVRILHQGKIVTGQEWAHCDYALGIFEIACAELCGEGHYTMRGFLVVEPRASYEWWLKDECENASEPPPAWKYWKD